eukprot:m.4269 g.4269  ORF g.4269 m.4269 type:complete len:705 (-) comp2945_c0_seq1:1039-3153(-)
MDELKKFHEASPKTQFSCLDCSKPFGLISDNEKLYAHYIGQASFDGALICYLQTSPESPKIFALFIAMFTKHKVSDLKSKCLEAGVTEDQFTAFLAYTSTFFANAGNYRSFGDTKIVPSNTEEEFQAIVKACEDEKISTLYDDCKELMFSLEQNVRTLGFKPSGITTYYSSNCTVEDAKTAQKFMDAEGLSPYNTRLFKNDDGKLIVRIAAAEEKKGPVGDNISVEYGDYAPIMSRISDSLLKAKQHAANDNQRAMLDRYVASFNTGSIDEHKQGSRFWIRDIGPTVESYIGFIESYQDPFGVRGEWEGFVAIVDKDTSTTFAKLVDGAEELLALMPWPKTMEKDKFLKPDFTSLDVLSFGSSGIPLGINIPNYDDVRQNDGFKNVSLGNVLKAKFVFSESEKVTFLTDADQAMYKEYVLKAFDVQVGLHELLGHGSGKTLCETSPGQFNFDKATTINPLTEKPVESWYGPGETYDGRFADLSSPMEECRAETVGIFLCTSMAALKIFGYTDETEGKKIIYINWLHMCRAGITALEFYSPEKGGRKGWGQAHMMARFAILQMLLEAGEGLVKVVKDDKEGTQVILDQDKIMTVGMKAVSQFLLKMQIYKATADVDAAIKMFEHYTAVKEDMLELRNEVISKRKPRSLLVQPVTKLTDDGKGVELVTYDNSAAGLIESSVARWAHCAQDLIDCAAKEASFHRKRD